MSLKYFQHSVFSYTSDKIVAFWYQRHYIFPQYKFSFFKNQYLYISVGFPMISPVTVTAGNGGSVSLGLTDLIWLLEHDDIIKWKHFPCYWPFVRGIHRSLVNSLHKGQWCGALMFYLICALNKQLSERSWGWWFDSMVLILKSL